MNKINFINNFYLKNNLKIFPVMENGKLPLIDAWQNECSKDFLQVLYWLENAKNCNIGLPANENNLFIIDIDMHEINGLDNWKRLCDDIGIDPNINTLTQETPSGGIHYIFKSDDELKQVMNSSNCFKNYQGIDIRTKGYVLVEPSMINGKHYKLNDKQINDIPKELKEFILTNNKQTEIERKEYCKPKSVDKGGRDSSLFDYINYLYNRTRLDINDIRLLAYNFNRTICNPPLTDNVVDYKINRLFKKPRNKFILIYLNEEKEEEEINE